MCTYIHTISEYTNNASPYSLVYMPYMATGQVFGQLLRKKHSQGSGLMTSHSRYHIACQLSNEQLTSSVNVYTYIYIYIYIYIHIYIFIYIITHLKYTNKVD